VTISRGLAFFELLQSDLRTLAAIEDFDDARRLVGPDVVPDDDIVGAGFVAYQKDSVCSCLEATAGNVGRSLPYFLTKNFDAGSTTACAARWGVLYRWLNAGVARPAAHGGKAISVEIAFCINCAPTAVARFQPASPLAL